MIGIRISVHSVFSACLVLLLLAPARAWALSSTPVTVVNPTTAPVPTVQQNTGDAAAANAKAMGVQTPFVVQGSRLRRSGIVSYSRLCPKQHCR